MKTRLLFIFFIPIMMYGQTSDKEVFHIRYGIAPLSSDKERDVVHTLDLNVKLPLSIKDKTILAAGMGYETLWTNDDLFFGGSNVEGVSIQGLVNHNLGYNRALLVAGSAGMYSDFKDISSEDFRYAIGVRYKTKLHEKFSISYGLGISKQFFGIMVAPFIDFDWKMTSRMRLSGPLPLNTRLHYIVSARGELMLFLKPDNATYRLSQERYSSQYFQKKQWNMGLGFDYKLTRHWVLAVKGGYSLRRRFEIYEASQTGVLSIFTFDLRGGKRTPSYQYEERALFAEVTMAWIIAKD